MRSLPLLALALLFAQPVRAEVAECTPITSLPATLGAPGVYCLQRDLSTAITAGEAITIAADDVTLDCNGYRIGGLAAAPEMAYFGVWSRQHDNVTVRGCTVRGFKVGIGMDSDGNEPALNLLVEGNRVDGSGFTGIHVEGDASTVRGNIVTRTGGVLYRNPASGITARYGTSVIDNTIDGVTANGEQPEAAGIIRFDATGGNVVNNRVHGFTAEVAYGILLQDVTGVVVRGNTLSAPYGYWGVRCEWGFSNPVSDNVVFGFLQPVSDCWDGGGNLRGNPEEG